MTLEVDGDESPEIRSFFVQAGNFAVRLQIPIFPGIMPITNYHQLARFSDACGAEIPRWMRKRLEAYGDDIASIRAFGEEAVASTSYCAEYAGRDG